jgi:hypothetical protein
MEDRLGVWMLSSGLSESYCPRLLAAQVYLRTRRGLIDGKEVAFRTRY